MKDLGTDVQEKRSRINGIEIVLSHGKWCWADNLEPIGNTRRPCPHCGKLPTRDGEDGCLGHLPGVMHACCGHGVEDGYITFENGMELEFRLLKIPTRATPTPGWKSLRER